MAAVAQCCPVLRSSRLAGPLSVFCDVPEASVSVSERLLKLKRGAPCPRRIFLMARDCQANDGQPWVPSVVRKIWQQILNDPTLNHECLPPLGSSEFTRAAMELAIGKENTAILENRAAGIQTLGGSGALWLGAQFLHRWYCGSTLNERAVYISQPTWESHCAIFQDAGFTDIRPYRYWDNEKLTLDVKGLIDDLESAPDFTIVVLDSSSYNAIGMGLESREWEWIADMAVRKKMFPFFYLPSQGLTSGDLETDSAPVCFFAEKGLELLCAQSFSRNCGLYAQRVGNLIIITKENEALLSSRSQLEKLVIAAWGSPPALGARIATTILNNPTLYAEWKENLKVKVEQTLLIREKIKEKLRILGVQGCWDHITQQAGLYSFFGLTPLQVEFLSQQKHIYLNLDGQFNISCLNNSNLEYVMQSISEAVTATGLETSQ
ncbi:putative aspartate aminotransferase, cytoplasmic 2 [Ambystoma mexicanum]|uniref:putative aspartate aminotransferase, cytoplasmic 2 n=1 Tax=Ambystoma mexicanum TaxID=8296 RepID=UPI0037E8E311